jgi:hypothetical protein
MGEGAGTVFVHRNVGNQVSSHHLPLVPLNPRVSRRARTPLVVGKKVNGNPHYVPIFFEYLGT